MAREKNVTRRAESLIEAAAVAASPQLIGARCKGIQVVIRAYGARCFYVLLTLLFLGGALYFLDEWWIGQRIAEARSIAEQGDQYWPTEMERTISRAETWELNRAALAERLAADRNASLAAEGMLMLLRHPSGHDRQVFERHLKDARVNHLMYTNSELAKICLRVLALRNATHLSSEESAYVNHWTSSDP